MSNSHFKEKKMTLKAKGLLSLMLSLPEGWDFSINGLCALSKDGRDSVMKTLQELEEFGYLKRTVQRSDSGQIMGYDYDVYEQPYSEKPYTEKPYSEKPYTENPQQLNTNNNINTNNINNLKNRKESVKEKNVIPPSFDMVNNYIEENNLNVEADRFIDYYDSKGWIVGKTKMKDWQATLRNWDRRNKPEQKEKKVELDFSKWEVK